MYDIFKELLARDRVTPYKVAKETGIATATLSDWKNGRSVPKPDKLKKIADYFGVSIDYLLTGNSSSKSNFIEKETLEIASILQRREDLKLLFQSCTNASPSDIRVIAYVLESLKAKENQSKSFD